MKRIFAILFLCAACAVVHAQGPKDIRINEFMVVNENNYEDDYGHRIGWIELFNTGHSKVNLAGCYISVKLGDPSMTYRIPADDSRTIIDPLGYAVFFCDGTDTKGTFHTNFTLDKTGYIAFLDSSSDGKPIDEVRYDVAAQRPDISMGRTFDKDGNLVLTYLTRTTPLATNELAQPVPQHELFRQQDKTGGILTITAMVVVFAALLVLYLLFMVVGKVMNRISTRRKQEAEATTEATAPLVKNNNLVGSEDDIAAIALALNLFQNELHDKQSTVLTINRVARAYSPWSSKIYGLRQMPNRR